MIGKLLIGALIGAAMCSESAPSCRRCGSTDTRIYTYSNGLKKYTCRVCGRYWHKYQ